MPPLSDKLGPVDVTGRNTFENKNKFGDSDLINFLSKVWIQIWVLRQKMIQIGTLVLEWYANLSRFCQNALLNEFITVGAVAGSGCGGSGACAATHPTRRPVRLIPPQHVLTLKAEKQKKYLRRIFPIHVVVVRVVVNLYSKVVPFPALLSWFDCFYNSTQHTSFKPCFIKAVLANVNVLKLNLMKN